MASAKQDEKKGKYKQPTPAEIATIELKTKIKLEEINRQRAQQKAHLTSRMLAITILKMFDHLEYTLLSSIDNAAEFQEQPTLIPHKLLAEKKSELKTVWDNLFRESGLVEQYRNEYLEYVKVRDAYFESPDDRNKAQFVKCRHKYLFARQELEELIKSVVFNRKDKYKTAKDWLNEQIQEMKRAGEVLFVASDLESIASSAVTTIASGGTGVLMTLYNLLSGASDILDLGAADQKALREKKEEKKSTGTFNTFAGRLEKLHEQVYELYSSASDAVHAVRPFMDQISTPIPLAIDALHNLYDSFGAAVLGIEPSKNKSAVKLFAYSLHDREDKPKRLLDLAAFIKSDRGVLARFRTELEQLKKYWSSSYPNNYKIITEIESIMKFVVTLSDTIANEGKVLAERLALAQAKLKEAQEKENAKQKEAVAAQAKKIKEAEELLAKLIKQEAEAKAAAIEKQKAEEKAKADAKATEEKKAAEKKDAERKRPIDWKKEKDSAITFALRDKSFQAIQSQPMFLNAINDYLDLQGRKKTEEVNDEKSWDRFKKNLIDLSGAISMYRALEEAELRSRVSQPNRRS